MNRQINVELPHAAFIYRKTRRSVFPLNRVLVVAQRVSAFMNSKPVGEIVIDADKAIDPRCPKQKQRALDIYEAIGSKGAIRFTNADSRWLVKFNEALFYSNQGLS